MLGDHWLDDDDWTSCQLSELRVLFAKILLIDVTQGYASIANVHGMGMRRAEWVVEKENRGTKRTSIKVACRQRDCISSISPMRVPDTGSHIGTHRSAWVFCVRAFIARGLIASPFRCVRMGCMNRFEYVVNGW